MGDFLDTKACDQGTTLNFHNFEAALAHSEHSFTHDYVREFQDGTFRGSGTLRFSYYVGCDLSRLGEGDWDVFEGTHDRHVGSHGHGTLRYNHGSTRFGDWGCLQSIYPPPGIRGWQCTAIKCGTSEQLFPSDPIDVFGCVRDVYTGALKNGLFHGRRAYSFVHPDSWRTVSYEAEGTSMMVLGTTTCLMETASC